ncbi:MAG: MaoC family dehydratase [Alphaproteobacteria bacterium]|nr:MaoC family dehydratase [Alphaproteobacteria bacterium]
MITYDTLVPPQIMGAHELLLDADMFAHWRALFPDDDTGDAMPHGMVAAIVMRAYTAVLHPRPPGNVHAAQHFDLLRLPRLGERLTTRVTCLAKERRKGRGWVTFGTETEGEAGPAFSGRMTMIWAA